MQKKVTLSIDSKVYDKFKKFCEDNAIMLSKKIELIIDDMLENPDKYSNGFNGNNHNNHNSENNQNNMDEK